jgi:hypothetical protein
MSGSVAAPSYVYGSSTGAWVSTPLQYTFSSVIEATYEQEGSGSSRNETQTLTDLHVDLSAQMIDSYVGGSVLFDFRGTRYRDVAGTLFTGPNSAPVNAGSIDVQTGLGLISEWSAGARTFTGRALLTAYGRWPLENVQWRTLGSPVRVGSFQVTDGTDVAIADNAGDLQGAATITGTIDEDFGVYDVTFDPPVLPEQARYNAVVLTYLPIDAELLGLNSVRLPLDGRVPIFQPGNMVVLVNTDEIAMPNPVIAGETYDLSRGMLAYAIVRDQAGVIVPTDRYTIDLDAGEITFANPLDLDGYDQPLRIEHRIEDMMLCTDAQLSGEVSISGAITHDFPASNSYLCSAKRYGTLQARATEPFDQQAWTGEWSDEQIGSEASAEYNAVLYPITVTNAGAITERWRIEFTGVSSFRLIGETTGQIATGSTTADFAPINPATEAPYFSIPMSGWGSGWASGNQLRFNTYAAAAPIWLLRCTLQGPATEPTDSFRLQFRGDN